MKFKKFIDSDIEDFRKLNIGIVENSKDELVHKIQEKFGIENNIMNIINDINILIGKRNKVGFTFETDNIEKKINKLNNKKKKAIKIKLLESNSFLSEMKSKLEKKLSIEGEK